MSRMAEGNGEIPIEEVSGKDSDVGRTPDYRKLIEYGLDPKVSFYCSYMFYNLFKFIIYLHVKLKYIEKKIFFNY